VLVACGASMIALGRRARVALLIRYACECASPSLPLLLILPSTANSHATGRFTFRHANGVPPCRAASPLMRVLYRPMGAGALPALPIPPIPRPPALLSHGRPATCATGAADCACRQAMVSLLGPGRRRANAAATHYPAGRGSPALRRSGSMALLCRTQTQRARGRPVNCNAPVPGPQREASR
jgi:hypothetical protein